MFGVEIGCVDRLLQIHAVMHVAQEGDQRPLLLLVAARRAEGEPGLAVAQRHRGRQRGARPLAGLERSRHGGVQPEHLAARAQAEAELGNDRRALQPAAAGRGRDHVAVPVDHVEMHGVAGHHSVAAERGLARAMAGVEPRDRGLAHGLRGQARNSFQHRAADQDRAAETRNAAGPDLARRFAADQLAALVGVVLGQQALHRHLDEIRIGVERLAIRERQLEALHDGVHEFRAQRIHRRDVVAREQGEGLQHRRALAPRPAFAHRVAVIVELRRLVVRGLPTRHVVGGDQAAMPAARRVHHLVRGRELADRLGHEALRPDVPRMVDALLARASADLRLARDARIGFRQARVAEQLAAFRRLAAGQIHRRGSRPFLGEHLRQRRDGV